jgi:2-dehydro-3-deoxyphosphogluconate aldolase/(4S)-4-hydroxy-2-oxoglutarate aldolase
MEVQIGFIVINSYFIYLLPGVTVFLSIVFYIYYAATTLYFGEVSMKTIDAIMDCAPVIPVLAFEDVAIGEVVCRALYNGGMRVFEIVLTTPASVQLIERVQQHIAPDIQVGIGRVMRASQIEAGKKAGASFASSLGFTPSILKAALDNELPLLPSVMTPSEMMVALEAGHNIMKFFTASDSAGLATLHLLHESFPMLKFYPALPNVMGVMGSWFAPKALIADKNWEEITHLARQACELGRHHMSPYVPYTAASVYEQA